METLRLMTRIFAAIGGAALIMVTLLSYWLFTSQSDSEPLRYAGVFLFVIPIAFLGVAWKVSDIVRQRVATLSWLLSEGQRVKATIETLQPSYVKHSGRMIVHITARWRPAGQAPSWVFHSGAVGMDVGHTLKISDPVELLIDPEDPNRYVFALSDECLEMRRTKA